MFNLKHIYIIVFLSLAGWAIFAYFTTTEIIKSQQEYAHIINISGKQRMLSQKTTLMAKRYHETQDNRFKEHLLSLYQLMKNDHLDIINDHVHSDVTKAIYHKAPNQLHKQVLSYLDKLAIFIKTGNPTMLNEIETLSFSLLPKLDRAVSLFEQESKVKTELLMERELFILLGTLITLILEAIFIVIPAIRLSLRKESELHETIKERTAELEKLSTTDTLTNLYNRRKIDDILFFELEKSKRYKSSLSLIMIDIDHFKKVNDTYGHQVGDNVLKTIASLFLSNVRKPDMVGRWGGEEFMIVVSDDEPSKIVNFAEKIRTIIENHSFDTVGKITCSFGIAHYHSGDTMDSLISHVDNALYKAKASGRNCVISY